MNQKYIKWSVLVLGMITAGMLWLLSEKAEGEAEQKWSRIPVLSEEDYAAVKAERSEKSGAEALFVRLSWEDENLPYDSRTNSFLRFETMKERELECRAETENILLGRVETAEGEKLIAYDADAYSEFSFWEAKLPVLTLSTEEEIAEEEYTKVEMTVFDEDSAFGFVNKLDVGMHTRGASSRWIPKKSYRVQVQGADESTEGGFAGNYLPGKNYPFFGMRGAREWILYSFYGDESKMREKLSRDLWDEIAQSSTYAEAGTGLQMEYCEVYLNDEYMGLYGMGTAVDRRNFWSDKASDRQDLLFKTINFDAPTLEDIAAVGEEEICKCLELKYASWKSKDMWDTIGQYMHLAYYASDEEYLEQMKNYMEIDNHIDYWLFFLASGLDDNELKNLYLSIGDAKSNTKVLMTPWDMDMSWGVGYTGEDIFMWGRNDRQYTKIMDFPIVSRMFSAGDAEFTEQTKARWKELRQDIITEEKMLKRVREYDELLWHSGVMEREMERWPEAKYASDSEYIENYINKRFVYLDEYMEQLGKGEWDDGWN